MAEERFDYRYYPKRKIQPTEAELQKQEAQETAGLIFTAGKTSQTGPVTALLQVENEALKHLMLGAIEKLGRIEVIEKQGSIPFNISETKIEAPSDFSEIPQWRGRKRDGMPLDFIKAHFGQWLSAFGAEQDAVFMDQIRRHDRRLVTGLENQLREEGQGRKSREFVKTRSARIDQELTHVTVEDLQRIPRLASTLYSRHKRASEAKSVPRNNTP